MLGSCTCLVRLPFLSDLSGMGSQTSQSAETRRGSSFLGRLGLRPRRHEDVSNPDKVGLRPPWPRDLSNPVEGSVCVLSATGLV